LTRVEAGHPSNHELILKGGERYSSGNHPILYSVDSKGSLPKGKADGA
jgi:hypothetical protein